MASIQQNINQLTATTIGAALGAAHLYQGSATAKAKALDTRAKAVHQLGEEYADIHGEVSKDLTAELQNLHQEAYKTKPTAKRLQAVAADMEENEAVAKGAAAAESYQAEQQTIANLEEQRGQLTSLKDAAQKRIDSAIQKAQRERELERQARMAYIMDTQTRRDRASYTQQWVEEAKRLGGK